MTHTVMHKVARKLPLILSLALVVPARAAPSAATPAPADSRVLHVATSAGAPAHQRIILPLNKAEVVELDTEAHDVLVSNPDIVDAVVKSPKRIFLLAAKAGQTNAFFFDANGRQILSLDIQVEKDVTDLGQLMKDNLPNSAIKVAAMNDNVILSGDVSSAAEATRAADLAASFTGDPKKVVNMLKIAGGEQVLLKVRMAEMDRNIAKQFGVNLASAQIIGGTPLALSTSNPYGLVGQALSDLSGAQAGQVCSSASAVNNPIDALNGGGVCNIENNVQGQLKALEQVGLVHMLDDSNTVAVSGETAKFLAGGEFPVPAGHDQYGNVTVEFKQFGVQLAFTPVVISPGRISLQLSTEDSELTNTGALTLQGQGGNTANAVTIPALAVRRAETTVELPSGGSFAIAGLMQHTTKQTIDGFPGLKDMPVLGALFRSRDFQNNETELVVVISAYLVQPTAPSALAAPTDGFVVPSDPETLLLGRLNAVYKKDDKPVTPQASAPVGFVVR